MDYSINPLKMINSFNFLINGLSCTPFPFYNFSTLIHYYLLLITSKNRQGYFLVKSEEVIDKSTNLFRSLSIFGGSS